MRLPSASLLLSRLSDSLLIDEFIQRLSETLNNVHLQFIIHPCQTPIDWQASSRVVYIRESTANYRHRTHRED